MVKVKKDLTGRVFGRLTVLEQAEDYVSPNCGKHRPRWLCECSCAEHNRIIVHQTSLISGDTQSCGCLQKDNVKERFKKYNKYDLSGEYGVGWTTNTNREFYFDLEDYDKIKDVCWYERQQVNTICISGYDANIKKVVNMHTFLGYKGYDHIDRNEFNNRKSNLRPCSKSENSRNRSLPKNNTSGIIGVGWHKQSQKWRAVIKYNKQKIELGGFINKDDAIRARLTAEVKYFGEFAPQKHLYEQYGVTIQND